MSDFRHHLAEKEHKEHILALFRRSYNRDFPERAWTWRFADAPAGPGILALVSDGERVASHYAATPVWCRIGGCDVLTGLAGTTMTDPAYRGRGLFQQAARIAYAEMQRRGMQFVWGFPNSQIHRQRRRDLGWLTIAEIPMMRLKLPESSPSKRRPRPAQPVRSIGPAFDDLWRRLRDRHRLITRRDAAHLHWRYLANPGATYRILTLDGRDGLDGYCVVKLYQNEFQIVDILADDDDTFADLVDSVVRIAKEENAPSIALWYNVHDSRHLLLESMGFANDSPVTYLSGTSQFGERDPESDVGCPIWLDYRNWYITMGDSDVF